FKDQLIYITQENMGQATARNIGIGKAKGEYIAFFDADDLFRQNKLEKQAFFLDHHLDYCMVYTAYSRIDEEGHPYPEKKIYVRTGDIFPQLFMRCFIAPSMVMCRRQALLDVGLFQTKFGAEDYDLFLRLAMYGKVGYLPEPLTTYRVRRGSSSKIGQIRAALESKGLLDQYKDYLFENYRLGWWYYRKRMSKIYREQAKVYLSQEKISDARRCLKRSLGLYPFRFDVIRKYLIVRAQEKNIG
ncbi:MAG: glycosyltransferase, partial [Acidobacteriota bacterium]|nr:glycosyltransferase [Acidobacteriota bacterium]